MSTDLARNAITYASNKIRDAESYEMSKLWPLIDDEKNFMRGVLLLSGVQRVEVSHEGAMVFLYQVDPDGTRREVLSLDGQTHNLTGAYSGMFTDTVKAIFSLECTLDSVLLLPQEMRQRRLSDIAERLNISSSFIIEVSKRY